MKKIVIFLAVFALAAVGSGVAHAHTTSIGFVSAGTPGAVTFWTGSYRQFRNPVNEGTLTLEGINGNSYASTTQAFNISPTSIKPVGLVDGTSNFYWTSSSPRRLDKTLTSDPNIAGGVVVWQGVTFAGLSAGDYSFSCGATCGTTVQWASWTSRGTGTLTLSGAIVGGGNPAPVPEPGTIVLMGSGLIGLAIWGRKKSIANA